MNSLIGLSAQHLRRAADLEEQIEVLQDQLAKIIGGVTGSGSAPALKTRHMSAAGLAAIRAGVRAAVGEDQGNHGDGQVGEEKDERRGQGSPLCDREGAVEGAGGWETGALVMWGE